ncbi:hypothetical protein EUX98_g9704, partial [Antrodiella citrinella]
EARGQHLLKTFKSYGDKLKLVIIPDISAPGAFDEAVKGIDAVLHTAAVSNSPAMDAMGGDFVINSAVQGNMGLLTSAQKYGSSIKRIVLTSSGVARTNFSTVHKLVDDDSWNDEVLEEYKKQGKDANNAVKYMTSKTLAEKRAWEWYDANKAGLSWDLTTLSPPWIFAPVLYEINTYNDMGFSNQWLYKALVLNKFTEGDSPLNYPAHGWVDARDVAELHVRALEVPAAGGEGIMLVAGEFVWQDAIDVANALSPSPWPSHKQPFYKGLEGLKVHYLSWDTSKEKKIFGHKFKTLEETMTDILADYEKRGWA